MYLFVYITFPLCTYVYLSIYFLIYPCFCQCTHIYFVSFLLHLRVLVYLSIDLLYMPLLHAYCVGLCLFLDKFIIVKNTEIGQGNTPTKSIQAGLGCQDTGF